MVDNDLPGTIIICKNLFLVLLSFVCHCFVVAVYTAEADLVSRYHGKGMLYHVIPLSERGFAIETVESRTAVHVMTPVSHGNEAHFSVANLLINFVKRDYWCNSFPLKYNAAYKIHGNAIFVFCLLRKTRT